MRPSATIALLALLAAGCDGTPNQAPVFGPVDDAVFRVDVAGTIAVQAVDPEGDPIEYRFVLDPVPPSQAEGLPGGPRFAPVGAGGGLLSWTPTDADAGQGEVQYRATFIAIDDRGGRVELVVPITVVAGRAAPQPLRFVAPEGEGILLTGDCLPPVEVEVEGEGHAPEAISIEVDATFARCDGQPNCEPIQLEPPGAGPLKSMSWCPAEAQLDASAHHQLQLRARSLAGDAAADRRFFVRFHRPEDPACGGEPPVIEHAPPGTVEGPLDYVISARITDDLEIKATPVLAYAVDVEDVPDTPGDIDGWRAVAFSKQAADRWQAAIPNLGLGADEQVTIHYAIFAVDNDDGASTACDHTSEAGIFRLDVRGSDDAQPAYPPCTPCRSDDQCGGEDDLCAILFDGAFCAGGCAGHEDCADDEICAGVPSVDGIDAFVCVPADRNCGQLCAADPFEVPGEDGSDWAVPIEPGPLDALTLCDEDEDWFSVQVDAGDAVTVRAAFDGARGDLDLGLVLPGSAGFEHQSVGGGGDMEEVREPCAPQAGEALIAVWGFDGRVGPYALEVDVGPGECDARCTADRYESADGDNNSLDHAADIDLPFESGRLTICPADLDFYRFETPAGGLLRVELAIESERGDLGLRLWRGAEPIAESVGFRLAEVIEVMVGPGEVYAVEVFGQTDRSVNTYTLTIDPLAGAPCDDDRPCADGLACVDGRCVDAPCVADRDCGREQVCVTGRLGAPADRMGGRCASRCRGDGDCRRDAGLVCKALGDKSVCLLEGAQGVGERCAQHEECAGDGVCLDLPGGYCARVGCGACAGDTACAADSNGVEACYRACDLPGDCRVAEGYVCGLLGEVDAPICVPGDDR